MGTFAIVLLVGLVFVVMFAVVVAKASEGGSMEQFGLRSAREITETRESLDAEDLEQMLAAHNARRRKRGQAELSVEDVEMQVMQDRNEQIKRRDALLADRELDQLLEATNARRRARGLPERTRDEVRREFGSSPSGAGEA